MNKTDNPHIKKWLRMSPVERIIDSLLKKKFTREERIKHLQKEINDINKALQDLKCFKTQE